MLAAVVLAPVLFKKEMREIKVFSYLLLIAVVAVIVLTGYELSTADGRSISEVIVDGKLMQAKPGHGLISALSIVSLAFIFHF